MRFAALFDRLQTHLAAAATQAVTAHSIMGERALLTARSSAPCTLLQPQTRRQSFKLSPAHALRHTQFGAQKGTAGASGPSGARLRDVQPQTHHLGPTVTLLSWFHKAITTLRRVQQLRDGQNVRVRRVSNAGKCSSLMCPNVHYANPGGQMQGVSLTASTATWPSPCWAC